MITAEQMAIPELTEETYRKEHGLSFSSMKALKVSPFQFWYQHVNPERPVEEPTPQMIFGSALHAKVLQPENFDSWYARKLSPSDFETCLETIEDIRGWIKSKGFEPKGTRKADVIAQAQRIDPACPIFDSLKAIYEADNAGKTMLSAEMWDRVIGCAGSLMEEPHIQRILEEGEAEKIVLQRDEETGVLLKSKQDWVTPKLTLDVKTFSNSRGKTVDEAVADAIWYEGYYRQAAFYSMLRGWPKWDGDFVLAFVESEPPYETRIRVLRGKTGGQPNVYWTTALMEIRGLIRRYHEYWTEFGVKPWRHACDLDPLIDEELKGMIF